MLVKQSSSGICHDTNSPYYNSVKSYTSFKTVKACLAHNGRLPKSIKSNSKSSSESNSGYSRAQFGHGWADNDHDCQDSRQEALIRQSTSTVTYNSAKQCRVIRGKWISPYSGKVIYKASQIDIDHIVPLSWAWQHGANKWTKEKRQSFANDPANLVSVEASLNRQKGDKGPDEWLPPKNRCSYVARFARIAKKYQLPFNAAHVNTHCTTAALN
ncbi:HNH endonuclease family protein [Vibrio sp.]|nr:HNH endonuclease family protein [Vibrio sp.]